MFVDTHLFGDAEIDLFDSRAPVCGIIFQQEATTTAGVENDGTWFGDVCLIYGHETLGKAL